MLARADLELQAAAVLELQRRKNETKFKGRTTYGIVCPKEGLLRSVQLIDGELIEVDKEPLLLIPLKLERLLKPKRFKLAFGGRGGAKSNTFGDILADEARALKLKIACFREMQNSIEDSVHSLLDGEIERLGFDGFTVEKASIYHEDGGEFRFRGLAKNPDAVKSMYGFKRFWVEEAQSISKTSLRKLTPTLREAGSEVWLSMNPESSEDPVYKRFIKPFESELLKNGYYEDDIHTIVHINYYDNPWFPDTLEQDRQWDKEHLSAAEYDHIWLGKTNDTIENAIIKREWFDAAIDAHIKLGFKPRGVKVLAHDPSDTGDPRAYAIRHGSVFIDIQENDRDDVNDACDWALDAAIANNVDLFDWDADGLGVTLKRQIADSLTGKKIDYQMFKGSNGVDNPDQEYQSIEAKEKETQTKTNAETFKNKRSQYAWYLRDRFYKTYRAVEKKEYIDPDELISISSNIECIDKLRSEVCRVPKKPNGNGLIQLMTKQEMKNKYEIESPNMFDCMFMSLITPEVKKKDEPIKYGKLAIV